MSVFKVIILSAVVVLLIGTLTMANDGGGEVKLGWVFLDEEGNQSVNHPSFNYYDGPVISLENFRYCFDNGIQLRSSLRNVTLQNRYLSLDVEKPGIFGADFRTNRYRRVYDFDGNTRTKRDVTSVGFWANPISYVKVFAGGNFNTISGRVANLFNPTSEVFTREVDYGATRYNVGARGKYQGRMLHAEYNHLTYSDNHDQSKDQTRKRIRLFGYAPVPRCEWLVLSGVFDRFETEYDASGVQLTSTTGKGSILANLPHNVALNYVAFFNRAGSDSDFVKTDNVAHLFYASYNQPGKFGVTVGYQRDVNDDFEDAVKANSYYLAGRVTPDVNSELHAEYGLRAEEVDDGLRLIGNEDRNRFKLSGKYRFPDLGSLGIGVETKSRENEQLESEAEFTRFNVEANLTGVEYFVLTGGFAYAKGDYENPENTYSFDSKQLHLNVTSQEYRNATAGFGLTYFRNQKDLDAEGIDLMLNGSYRFAKVYRAEFTYRVFNFDDFLAMDQYYTENIFEINLIRSFSL